MYCWELYSRGAGPVIAVVYGWVISHAKFTQSVTTHWPTKEYPPHLTETTYLGLRLTLTIRGNTKSIVVIRNTFIDLVFTMTYYSLLTVTNLSIASLVLYIHNQPIILALMNIFINFPTMAFMPFTGRSRHTPKYSLLCPAFTWYTFQINRMIIRVTFPWIAILT